MNHMSAAAKTLRGLIIEQILKTNPELNARIMDNMSDEQTLIEINSMCEAIIQAPDFLRAQGVLV